MQVIVNDASALIDLHKAGLLRFYSKLSYELVIPDQIFEELNSISEFSFENQGFKVVEFGAKGTARLLEVLAETSATYNDSFALVHAESRPGSILLTGDKKLRKIAKRLGIQTHGTLWLLDQMHDQGVITSVEILSVLTLFEQDTTIRVPVKLLKEYRAKYG